MALRAAQQACRGRCPLLPAVARGLGGPTSVRTGQLAKCSTDTSDEDRIVEAIAAHYSSILALLGEDTARKGIVKTPLRAAKAMRFLTSGMRSDLATVVNSGVFDEDHHEMVIVRNIEVHSLCEHHLLPFIGRAHVGYLPNSNGSVVGLSKVGRIVDLYARRLQVQERLTTQVAAALDELIAPRGVAVAIEATHMCMQMRGVQKSGASTITTSMLGVFDDNATVRGDFLRLIGMPNLSSEAAPSSAKVAPSCCEGHAVDGAAAAAPPREGAVGARPGPPSAHASAATSAAAVEHMSTIRLFKEAMKFSAGHFTIFGHADREKLHGHNFGVQVSITAPVVPGTGMIADYNVYKRAIRGLCDEFDELLLLPGLSPHLSISHPPQTDPAVSPRVRIELDGASSQLDVFEVPASDVRVLPVANVTLEEISRLFATRMLEQHKQRLAQDRVARLTVAVSSGPGQTAEHVVDLHS